MPEIPELADRRDVPKIRWMFLLIVFLVGGAPTAISFLLEAWWLATLFLLLTLLVACFAFKAGYRPAVFTLYAVFAIGWVAGLLIDQYLGPRWIDSWLGMAAPLIGGGVLGILVLAVTWLLIGFVSTKWILSVSDSFDVSFGRAFRFVLARIFDISQVYLIVENGQIAVEKPKGLLSRLGGPGVLVVRQGNAVVLELGGKTRIVGPGLHSLRRFEQIKKPAETKGIVDLTPQWASDSNVENVLTKDGIPLEMEVGVSYQIELKSETDKRASSHLEGGEATSRVIEGDYPVYEATVRKAVFNTTAGGWKVLFPVGPISILRDVVSSYTFDQIFAPDPSQEENPDPDQRTVRRIEEEVQKRFNASWAGVQFKMIDIQAIHPPADVHDRLLRRWTTAVERKIKLKDAETEREAMIERSRGRAGALDIVDRAQWAARNRMVNTVNQLLTALSSTGNSQIALSFVSVIEELTKRVGEDEMVTMQYIEAMRAIVQSEGPKSFVITPPTPAPGMLPSPPPPTPGEVRVVDGEDRDKK